MTVLPVALSHNNFPFVIFLIIPNNQMSDKDPVVVVVIIIIVVAVDVVVVVVFVL